MISKNFVPISSKKSEPTMKMLIVTCDAKDRECSFEFHRLDKSPNVRGLVANYGKMIPINDGITCTSGTVTFDYLHDLDVARVLFEYLSSGISAGKDDAFIFRSLTVLLAGRGWTISE